LKQQNRLRSS